MAILSPGPQEVTIIPLILLLDPSSFSSSLLNPSFPFLSLLPSFPSLSLLSSYPFSSSLFSPPPLPSFAPLSSSSSSSSFLPQQHTGMPPLLQTHLVDQNGVSVVRYVYIWYNNYSRPQTRHTSSVVLHTFTKSDICVSSLIPMFPCMRAWE